MATYLVHRLAAVGYGVKVYLGGGSDFQDFARCGAKQVDVPADAAEDAGLVIVAMPDERTVEDAVFDCGGVSETLPDGHAVIDLSSVSPAFSARARDRMVALGLVWLEGSLVGEPRLAESWPLCVVGAQDGLLAPVVTPVVHELARHVEVWRNVTGVTRMRLALESLEPSTAA
jgi:3-hydroxyisobutyrate dehydrogenase